MANLGTGYLYGWGIGPSGEALVPEELLSTLVAQPGPGQDFTAAMISGTPLAVVNEVVPQTARSNRFSFQIFNSDAGRPSFNAVSIMSTFSGTESGAQQSGSGYYGTLNVGVTSGVGGTFVDRMGVALGQSLGTGSGRYAYPQDTKINSTKNNKSYKDSDSWQEYEFNFDLYDKTGFSGSDAGIYVKDVAGILPTLVDTSLYTVNYGSDEVFASGTPVRQKFLWQTLGDNFPSVSGNIPIADRAWASYNVETGISGNSRNVFSWAVEIVETATMRGEGIFLGSGAVSGDPFLGYRQLLAPQQSGGFQTSFNDYIGYCFNRLSCENTDVPPEDVFACYTGESIESQEYTDFVSGVLAEYSGKAFTDDSVDGADNLNISSGAQSTAFFAYETGSIYYNSFIAGDTVSFDLYPFDYTGMYQEYQLGNSPLYPSTGFTLAYPTDFTDIDGLVTQLNNRLSGTTGTPVWYPYECLKNQSTGVYISGTVGLMGFYKDVYTGLSGTINYNNIIHYRSLRNYQSGFNLSLSIGNRDEYVEELAPDLTVKGLSYLLPDVLELQALSGDRWIVLDQRSGLNETWPEIENVERALNANADDFYDGEFANSSEITGLMFSGFNEIEEVNFQGGFQTLQQFEQTQYTPAAPYCQTPRSARTINIVLPTGWPVGSSPCTGGEIVVEESGAAEATPTQATGKEMELTLAIKRTGFSLDPYSEYLSCIAGRPQGHDITAINFSGYRVVAKNFSDSAAALSLDLLPTAEVYIANINLFSATSVDIGIHTGDAQCLIGADYVLDVQDIVGVPLNDYNFEYTLTDTMSGVFVAQNYIQTETLGAGDRAVSFATTSGGIVGDVTGLVNGLFTGTGYFTHDFGNYYYYDPGTELVTFLKTKTGLLTGSGYVGGPEIAVKDYIINQELLQGGRFSVNPVYTEVITSGDFLGDLTGIEYVIPNTQGLYLMTGTITGMSSGGYFIYDSFLVTGSGTCSPVCPYYEVYTGVVQSESRLAIDFDAINNFDVISINNSTVVYNSETGTYQTPNYFFNVDTLLESVNTNDDVFFCSGVADGSGVIFTAVEEYAPGVSGNLIYTTGLGSGLSFGATLFTGGESFYPRLYPDTNFTGLIKGQVASTGFYTEVGSGTLTGNLATITGFRSFTGCWDIMVGGEPVDTFNALGFASREWERSGSSDFHIVRASGAPTGYQAFAQYLLPTYVAGQLSYNNMLGLDWSVTGVQDVAELTIIDRNFSLVYPTGNAAVSDRVVFRITGGEGV